MIETYKIITGKEKVNPEKYFQMLPDPEVQGPRTRVKKIYKKFASKDVRRCSFTMRVTNGWNELTNEIVSARKTSKFKARLDAFTAARTLVRRYDMYTWR